MVQSMTINISLFLILVFVYFGFYIEEAVYCRTFVPMLLKP